MGVTLTNHLVLKNDHATTPQRISLKMDLICYDDVSVSLGKSRSALSQTCTIGCCCVDDGNDLLLQVIIFKDGVTE